MKTFFIDRMPTPVGELILICDDDGNMRALDWSDHEKRLLKLLHSQYNDNFMLQEKSNPNGLTAIMERYFSGDLTAINAISVVTAGTPFQRTVWQQLRKIPCGSTITYGQLAQRINRPTACRAVGMANGLNPISIVVPCHRVIGSQGKLTGYAGGIERKQWLLRHEGYLTE